jgi:predicted TIM-barrel fold metal-dependent hydrolase
MTIIDLNTMFGPLPAAAADLSVDELTLLMQQNGIASCCTASTVGLLVDHNAGNSATKAACADQSNLLPAATVNPQTYFGGEGAHTRFREDGFKLVRFFPAQQGWEPDYAPFVQLAAQVAKDKLPIMIEIDRPGVATRLIKEVGQQETPLILSGVDHKTVSEAVALMRVHAFVCIETSSLLATGAIKHVVDCVGVERVLYGSGAPSRPMASGLGVLRSAGLNEQQLAATLGGNASRILGL